MKSAFDDMETPKKPLLQAVTEPYVGATEAAATLATGMGVGFPAGVLAGTAKAITSGLGAGLKTYEDVAGALTYQPQTETGKQYSEAIGKGIGFFQEPYAAEAEKAGTKLGGPSVGKLFRLATEVGIPVAFGVGAKWGKSKPTVKELSKIESQLKGTPEDIAVAKERIAGWLETDRVLALEPTRGRVSLFEDMPVEAPTPNVPVKGAYRNMTRPERAMADMYDKFKAQGLDDATIKAQMERIYPTELKGEGFSDIVKTPPEVEVARPTPTEVTQVTPGPRAGLVTEFVPRVEGEVAMPIEAAIERSDLTNLVPTKADVVPFTERNYMAAGEGAEGAVTSGTVPHPSTETGAVAIPPGIGAAIKEKGTSILRHVKEFFAPTSTLPEGGEWYRMARYKGLGDVDRAIGIGTKVFDKLKKLPDDSKFNIFQAVDGKIPMSDLSATDALVAKQIQNLNQRIGQMAVKRGILKEETFEANKDSYVKYLYLRHILPDDVQVKVTGGRIDFGWLKARKDLTREQQRGIGLIEDISVAEPSGVMTSLGDMAKWDFFNKVAQDPRAVWTPGMVEWNGQKVGIGKLVEEVENQRRVVTQAPNVPEAQARLASLEQVLAQAKEATGNVPEGFVQMPVSKSYGNLSGAFVAKPIFQDIAPVWQGFNSTGSTSKLLNMALNAERKAMAGYKVGKTALNLPTATRNVVSNFFQLAMSGMELPKVPLYMERGLVSMLKKDATWNQARRYGLFKTNWGAAEIGEVLDTVRTLGKERTGIFGMAQNLAKFYGRIDDVTKMAKFTEQLEKGMTPAKAAIEAHKWGMDYSLANPMIKVARQHVAPFVSYQYKIAPLIAETMKKKPWLIPTVGIIPYIMSDVSRRSMNITDEEWKKLKKDMPLYIRENQTYTLLPWKSAQGNPQWTNIEYFMPWQNFIALGTDIKNAKWGDIPRDFGIGNPLFDTLSAWASKGDEPLKDPFTRRPVYNTLDSPTDKAFKVSEWLMQTWGMPPMLSTKGAAGYTQRAASGEADKYGRTVTPGQAAARWFGVNVIAPSPLQSIRERRAMTAELKGSLAVIMKDPSVSPAKKQAAQKEFIVRMKELQGGQ